jgi:glutamate--cysteine ligase
VPPGLTFADWIRDGDQPRPTLADLDYHLSTLFPLVRPRGYLELRFLDTQPGDGWLAPVALLAGLGTEDDLLDEARRVCEPVCDQWTEAARLGLQHPPLAAAARALADVAARAVAATDLPPPERASTTEAVLRHLTPMERP